MPPARGGGAGPLDVCSGRARHARGCGGHPSAASPESPNGRGLQARDARYVTHHPTQGSEAGGAARRRDTSAVARAAALLACRRSQLWHVAHVRHATLESGRRLRIPHEMEGGPSLSHRRFRLPRRCVACRKSPGERGRGPASRHAVGVDDQCGERNAACGRRCLGLLLGRAHRAAPRRYLAALLHGCACAAVD